jgi:predicted CxxxxCH...CXXCH cytochrome family protein
MGLGTVLCTDCHNAGTTATTAPSTEHADNLIDTANVGYTDEKAKGSAYTTCSTSYCHSDGKGAYATPSWGGTSTGCTFCHPTLSGKHSSHVIFTATSVYGSTSANVTSSTTSYDFGCGNCHPVSIGLHADGYVDISLAAADGGTLKSKNSSPSMSGSGNTTQCNGVYCHSDGKATPAFVQTPQWGSSFANQYNTCGNCHGNSPSGTQHAAHVVGIHYDTIYTGTTDLATAGTLNTSSHGNSAYSTTINCNICHSSTVTKSRNKYGASCNGCHASDTDNTTNTMVTADMVKTVHVNGQPDVVFADVLVKSKAQVRDDITTVTELNNNWTRTGGYKAAGAYDQANNSLNTATWNGTTCSSIACHNGITTTWSSTLTCTGCHTRVPQ